jgi:Tfp pilus assembly protein PilP
MSLWSGSNRASRRENPSARAVIAIALGVALGAAQGLGCGDDGGTAPPPNPATPKPGAPGATGPKPPQLTEKVHVEDRVTCPIPDRPSDPKDGKCDLKAPSCAEQLYCLALAQGSYCEPCPERDGIRHTFKPRDFAVEQNRDPFQSFLFPQIPKPGPGTPIDLTRKCPREDQMIATSYSYADLKLVGIVAQGTLRKALMMGGPLGYIIKRGDCVGKEKAFVKDIGTGYITFVLEPDATSTSQRAPEEYSMQLNPKQLAVSDPELPTPAPRTAITPVVAPPAVLPPRTPVAGAGSAGPGSAVAPPVESPPGAPKKP